LRLELTDNPFSCTQQVVLVYRPSSASGWLNYLVEAMQSAGQAAEAGLG